MAAIEISNVTKRFGTYAAVNDVSLSVPEGSIYGFIGPNGSGKTTTIRMIMNILLPDTGCTADDPTTLGASVDPQAVVASAEASLRRLRSDHIDLLQLHNPTAAALGGTDLREALEKLRQAGKVRAWGVSAKSPEEAIQAVESFGAAVAVASSRYGSLRANAVMAPRVAPL